MYYLFSSNCKRQLHSSRQVIQNNSSHVALWWVNNIFFKDIFWGHFLPGKGQKERGNDTQERIGLVGS